MPALILAPSSELDVARLLAERLLEGGGEVRCYLEEDDFELRDLGCKVAMGDLLDEAAIEGALMNAHTFVPLFPDPAGLDDSALSVIVPLGESAARAAFGSNVEQVILPIPGLVRGRGPVGAAFRQVVEAFRKVHPVAVLVTGALWGAGRPLTRGIGSFDPGEISVLAVEGLVEAIAAADDRERIEGEFELAVSAGLGSRGEGETAAAPPGISEFLELGAAIGDSGAAMLGIQLKDPFGK